MKDEALTTPPGLTAAEAAVVYALKRMRVDADFRHHMVSLTDKGERFAEVP